MGVVATDAASWMTCILAPIAAALGARSSLALVISRKTFTTIQVVSIV